MRGGWVLRDGSGSTAGGEGVAHSHPVGAASWGGPGAVVWRGMGGSLWRGRRPRPCAAAVKASRGREGVKQCLITLPEVHPLGWAVWAGCGTPPAVSLCPSNTLPHAGCSMRVPVMTPVHQTTPTPAVGGNSGPTAGPGPARDMGGRLGSKEG